MKILVTGAKGYIGTGVLNALLNTKNEIIATDFNMEEVSPVIKTFSCDLFSLDNPYEYFGKPDVVLHLAWRNGFVHNALSHLEDLPEHYLFLEKMVKSGVKKIVVLGTMHEVGFWEGKITKDTPCKPLSLYGIAKNALRDSVELVCKQNNVYFQWIRGFYIVGNSERGASIFSKITAAEKEGKQDFPFTSGVNQYDFINYEDFCNQVAQVTINNTEFGIVNCCSGKPESLSSRVERFIKENHYKIRLNYGAFPDRPYDSLAVWGEDTRIKKILKDNELIQK